MTREEIIAELERIVDDVDRNTNELGANAEDQFDSSDVSSWDLDEFDNAVWNDGNTSGMRHAIMLLKKDMPSEAPEGV